MPCISILSIPLALVGLALGIISLYIAIEGKRHSVAFPIEGTAVSAVALMVVSAIAMIVVIAIHSALAQQKAAAALSARQSAATVSPAPQAQFQPRAVRRPLMPATAPNQS